MRKLHTTIGTTMLRSVAVASLLLLALSFAGAATNYTDSVTVNNATDSINVTATISVSNNTGGSIIVSDSTGVDSPECFNSSCRTLTYALTNAPSLNCEVVLFGDQWINQTLTISNMVDLVIRSGTNSTSVIRCSCSTECCSGLVFTFVSRLSIFNVKFEGCGTSHVTNIEANVHNYHSALLIINRSDVELIQTSFYRSKGRGVSIIDVYGQIKIRNSNFVENYYIATSQNETGVVYEGGGIHIELTNWSCDSYMCDIDTGSQKSSRFLIQKCNFEGNRVKHTEVNKPSGSGRYFPLNTDGQGGGLNVIVTGVNNSIVVENCTFRNNSADEGGGMNVIFTENAESNVFHIVGCIFRVNEATERGGGALQLRLYGTDDQVNSNSISVEDTHFTGNSARLGGAVAFFTSQSERYVHKSLTFQNCTFIQNFALMGSALCLRSKSDHGFRPPTVLLLNCNFVSNYVLRNEDILNIGSDGKSHPYLHSGSLYVESMEIDLLKYVSFNDNMGSGIVANAANVNVLQGTLAEFVNNSATNGGGIALLGPSLLQLRSGSQVVFDSNRASELGGAIYLTKQVSLYQESVSFLLSTILASGMKHSSLLIITLDMDMQYLLTQLFHV